MKLINKKTGEIVVCGEGIIEFKTFGCKNFAEFLESGWEDYKPAEPLIKDEKIRKAVRAWAEANDIERVWHGYSSCWLRGNGLKIELENEVVDLEQKNYTIAELCGEEEE